MKKIICSILVITMLLFLIGCGGSPSSMGMPNYLIQIPREDYLYYDENTYIVYILFRSGAGNNLCGYMSAYYDSNGLPYKYDPITKQLFQIEKTA